MSKEILMELERLTAEGDTDGAREAAKKSLDAGMDPLEVIEKGINAGLKTVGEKFERGEYFLPDLMAGAEAAQAALEVLKPALSKTEGGRSSAGRVLLVTVEGDIHDIGKNIVAAMLTAAGFETIDLGKDVPTATIVEKVLDLKPQVVALSALMTTTRLKQKEVIDALEKANCREKVKVIVGGAAVTADWANQIGADAYGRNSVDAVNQAKKLIASLATGK